VLDTPIVPTAQTAVSSPPRARGGSRDSAGVRGDALSSSGRPELAAERVSLLAWSCAGASGRQAHQLAA